jgi:hypothetical protein
MRIPIIILLSLFCLSSECQRIHTQGSVEKFEDQFDPGYYPIWTGSMSYYLNRDSTRYIELSGWGDIDQLKPSFIYVNLTFNFEPFWFSINPLRADIYNPTIQVGYTFQIFHPPRKF